MRTNPLVKIALVCILAWFFLGSLKAGDIHVTQRIEPGRNSACPSIIGGTSPCNTDTVSLTPFTGSFRDYNVQDYITLGIDHNNLTYLPDSFSCSVTIQIQEWDKNSVSLPTLTKTLNVRYTSFTYTTYLDKAAFLFKNAYMYKVTITNVNITGATATSTYPQNYLPPNVYLDADIRLQRYYDFTSTATTGIAASDIQNTALDIDCDSRPDELNISWSGEPGAEEYDLEWTFVNDYANAGALGTYLAPSDLSYNFRFNSTRITTSATSYKLTLAYEHGYVIYRVRGIGRDMKNPAISLYQAWSIPDSNNISAAAPDYYQVVTQHEYDSLNYQYNATFAEEGKKKEVVTYYDGSLRSREAVTKMNSDSNVLVGQTIYDYQGRPAVTVLPVPVAFPSCNVLHKEPSLHYYPNFSLYDSINGSTHGYRGYSRLDFDVDKSSCLVTADSMSVLNGASNYYSSSNPRQYGFYAYIPDAHGFPFSQVQYTPDNTGRIRAQGGVGPQFQLGSNHETKYIYGQPNQLEMDRMFGEEVGDATHYKKNVVIDPNGQASISYLDQEGRTIATCLAGLPGTDSTGHSLLAPLPSQAGAQANLQVDLFAADANGHSNNNSVNINGDGIVFNTQLSVAYQSNYTFNYTLQIDTLEIPCSSNSLCMNCVYDLQIQVLDDCGRLVTPSSGVNPISKVVGHLNSSGGFTTDCSVPLLSETDGYTVSLMPGNYTVSKTLTVDTGAVKYYTQQYENPANNSCVKSLSTFQSQYLTAAYADTCNCRITCASCLTSLGNRDDFVAMGKGTAEQYDFLYEQCTQPCKPNTLCDMQYQQMMADMSPSGQYGQYLTTSGVVKPGVYPVSVFNTNNGLPINVKNGTGNWKHPEVVLNGHTYPYYIDNVGNRSTVAVVKSGSNYIPAVDNTSDVFLNASNSQYYTYPENLTNVSDFLQFWQQSWSQSLVSYHPEYLYYQECQKYEVVQPGDTMSSQTFDNRLRAATTFEQAVRAGFIVRTTAGDSIVTNLFSRTENPGKMYDPFIVDASFQTDYGNSTALDSAFSGAYRNYFTVGSTHYNMMQVAAMGPRCGTNYSTTISSTCIDFGQNAYASTYPLLNKAIKDSEWNNYKIFYLSQKQKYQYMLENYQALHNYGYNICIGDTNFSAASMLVGSPQPFFQKDQPCGIYYYQDYISKQKRFVQQADVPNQGSGNASYQYYQQTGQCPIAGELQQLLSALVQTDSLTATNVTLFNYPQFTPDLYSAITGTPLPSTGVYYKWNYVAGTSTTDSLNATITGSNGKQCTFALSKKGTSITSWSGIQSLQNIQYKGTQNGLDFFTITAVVYNPSDPTGHPYSFKQLTGSSCIPIHGCQFQSECSPNDLATGVKNLMSTLAQYSALTSIAVDLETTTPPYKPLLTNAILNTLGAPNQNLRWSYLNNNEFDIYDNTDTINKLRFIFTSVSPTSFTINLTNLNKIKIFDNINSEGKNLFTVDAFTGTDSLLATLSGGVLYGNTAISMGTCGLPIPAQCQGAPYENLSALDSVFRNLFTGIYLRPTAQAHNYNLLKISYFNTQLASYLPGYLDSCLSREKIVTDIYPNDSVVHDTLKFEFYVSDTIGSISHLDSTSCPFYLMHKDTVKSAFEPTFNSLVSVKNFTAINNHIHDTVPQLTNGAYEDFYFIGGYRFVFRSDHDTIIYDTVFGHSCIPLLNCNVCNNNPQQTPVTYVPPAVSPVEPARALKVAEVGLPSVGDPIGDYNIAADSTGIWIPFKATSAYMLLKIHPQLVAVDTPFVPIEDMQLYDSTFRLVQVSDTMNIGSDTLPVIQALRVDSGTTYYIRAQKYSAGICPACYAHSGYFAFSSADVGFRDPAVPNCDYIAFGPNLLYDGDFETPPPFASNQNCYQVRSYVFPDSAVPAYVKRYPTVSRTRFEACGFSGDGSDTDYTDIYRVTSDMGRQFQNDAHSGTRFLGVDAPSKACSYCSTTDSTSTTKFYTPAYTSIAWAQRVITTPGTIYRFSFWVQTMDVGQAPGAVVSAYINGVQYFTDVISDSNGYATWKQISLCWQSNSDSAVIFIQGKGDASAYGYDYALDDIGFSAALNPPCNPPIDTNTFVISPPYTPKGGDACVNQYVQNAEANALNAYNNYIDSINTVVRASYMQHCLSALEGLTMNYQDMQYHYTLYSYDQAGNLIRTVPPQGVQLFGMTSSTDPLERQIIGDRTTGQHNVFNNNVLGSTYVYNSLNQLTEQSVPDDDNMQIWNFNLPNGLNSNLVVTGTQFTDATNGYLSGYVPNGSGRRGYLYKTHDGGHTWLPVNGTVAATMNSVVMTSAAAGYAVGDDGVVLVTADGGSSWDIVPLYANGVTQELNGVAYNGSNAVAVVGDGTAFALSTGSSTYSAATGISSTDALTSVTYDAVNSVFYAVGDSSGYGVFYRSTDNTATAWAKISSNTASLPLYKVQFLGYKANGVSAVNNTAHGFAAGLGGMLLHTTDRGAHWFAVPTYIHKLIRNLYFVNDNVGVALIDSIQNGHVCQLYQTSDGGVTWSLLSKPGVYYYDMSFYYDNSSSAYKGVAVGYKGVVTRIVTTSALVSPYFGLITLNSPSSYTLKGVFAEENTGNNLYMTIGSAGQYMYYTGSGLTNTTTNVIWDSVNVHTSTAETAFVLNSSNAMFMAAIGNTTHKIYCISTPAHVADSLMGSPQYNTNAPFYELAEHGTIGGSDSLYTNSNNTGTLYYLMAGSTELTMTPISTTPPAGNIISLAYSGNGNIAGVDSLSGNIYTGVLGSGSVAWTNVSFHTHPLTMYSIQAVGTGITQLYASGDRGEFLYGVASSTTATLNELVPVTTKTLYSAQAESSVVTKGLVAGDSSALYEFNYTPGNNSPVYTPITVSTTTTPLYDIAISGTSAYISGGNGTVYYMPSIPAFLAKQAYRGSNVDFMGIAATTLGGAIAVGSNANIWQYGTTNGIQVMSVYTPGLNAENFMADNANGYVVGDYGTIRRTDNGGVTWQTVLPEINSNGVPNITSVWTTSTGNAIMGGTGSFFGQAFSDNTSMSAAGHGYEGSSGTTWNKIRFSPNFPGSGFVVGSSDSALNLTVTAGIMTSYSDLPSAIALGSTDFQSLHVFRDNSFMAVGTNGKIFYYNSAASPVWNDESPTTVPSYTTYTWTDIDARDDRTMWAVGNSSSIGGSIIKVIDPVNIQPLSPSTTVSPIGSSWALEPIADGPTANNIVATANQVVINAIAFSGPYDGFVGGSYSGTPPSSTGSYPYARLLTDKGGVFAILQWYNRVGEQVVSQNTKQHNYKRPAYSYMLYDNLNRVIETGQKTENSDANTFNTIFGDTIMGFSNPSAVSTSKFLTWIKDNTGPRTEVKHTYYDVQDILPTSVLSQQQIRNRVASITYADTLRSDSTKYNNATHYSYDVHGSINTLIQDDSIQGIIGQRFKRIDYQYDLVSMNVNELDYENDSLDQYHQKYYYDADNRLAFLSTSRDSILWECDAKYFYYPHGLLARIELGDQQVQGVDYAYTLQGWIKGMNSTLLDGTHDMGHDALQQTGNLNSNFARDAAGFTITYFDKSSQYYGDYDAISQSAWGNVASRFEAYTYGSDVTNTRRDLFNHNVTAMSTSITQPTNYKTTAQANILPQGAAFNYDQLNRLIDMKAYQNLNSSSNVWETNGTYNGLYHDWLTYDENGNILTQKRADSVGEVFDSLTYQYNIQGGRTLQNRLYHVNDAANITGLDYDIKDEGTFSTNETTINQKNNYRYTAIGELAKDTIGGIDTIIWTAYKKPWKVKKYNGDSILFEYDALGNRIEKEYKPISGNQVNTYYVLSAKNSILGIYEKKTVGTSMTYSLVEHDIYGQNRIGSDNTTRQLIGAIPVTEIDTFNNYLGLKEYELKNHLDNVLAVVSDRKIPRPSSTFPTQIDHYEPDVISSTDYYPFGWSEPGRNFNSSSYRYAFNGKEKTNEFYGEGDMYDYGMRFYDTRLGRFISRDPLALKFPTLTPYQFASNSPLIAVDLDGLEAQDNITGSSIPKVKGAEQSQATGYSVSHTTTIAPNNNPLPPVFQPSSFVNGPTPVGPAVNNNAGVAFATFFWVPQINTANAPPQPASSGTFRISIQAPQNAPVPVVEVGIYDPAGNNGQGSYTPLWSNAPNGNAPNQTRSGVISYNLTGNQEIYTTSSSANGLVGAITSQQASPQQNLTPQAQNANPNAAAQPAVLGNGAAPAGGNGGAAPAGGNGGGAPAGGNGGGAPAGGNGGGAPAGGNGGGAAPAGGNGGGAPAGNNNNNCFVGGTKIMMADGHQISIEKIKVGDSIKTIDPFTLTIKNSCVYKIIAPIHTGLVEISFNNGKTNTNTTDHSYFVKGKGWSSFSPDLTESRYGIKASQLEIGDIVYYYSEGLLKEAVINQIIKIDGNIQTYNIYPNGGNNDYFANGIVVYSDDINIRISYEGSLKNNKMDLSNQYFSDKKNHTVY